jgi:hypothetical protein
MRRSKGALAQLINSECNMMSRTLITSISAKHTTAN